MCYKVHTHKMLCDVRPIISSAKTIYVNPYETPSACPCPRSSSSHSRSGRCPSHGCCRYSSAIYSCPKNCRRLVNYHRHVPAAASSSSFSPSVPAWRALRVFDPDPDFRAVESADFGYAISQMLDIGSLLLHAEAEMEKWRLRVERERAYHFGRHGACERARRECAWTRRVREMESEGDELRYSAELLAECWVKYVGLLRRYEGLGDRRVGGIVERPRSEARSIGKEGKRVTWGGIEEERRDYERRRGRARQGDGEGGGGGGGRSSRTVYVVEEGRAVRREPAREGRPKSWGYF